MERQNAGAEKAGFRSQTCGHDPRAPGDCLESSATGSGQAIDVTAAVEFGKERRGQKVPGLGYASADDIEGQIQHVNEVGESNAESAACGGIDSACMRVPGTGGQGEIGRREWACGVEMSGRGQAASEQALRGFGDGRAGRIRLKASRIPAPAGRALRVDGQVAGFCGHAGSAMPNAAIQNNSAPHTGAKSEHTKRVDRKLFSRTESIFSEGCDPCVSIKADGMGEAALQFVEQREVVPAG